MGKPSAMGVCLCVLLHILMAMLSCTTAEGVMHEHMSVNIVNNAGGELWMHCMSKDDDLGEKWLRRPGQTWSWGFKSNFWGTTLFWCYFRKVGPGAARSSSFAQTFDVWSDVGFWGEHRRPCKNCVWDVRPDGFYRAKRDGTPEDGVFQLLYRWAPAG
ncbi:S-protein homolog 20 [Physcomitrium patens]|uniref:S-protein homolog n=1 Tax=Physcomitrium patens TaxID=3218 RepID=A9RII9_PHYPA|nr:S-protein homolog 20-like [Physcomitrium patens]PNR45219.1 hypothetical protein PHYPA_014990 [Physcomitrium patens]|eukprot:XP_024389506.1 S-protein homolog 20-like [Physcomitrella patens]